MHEFTAPDTWLTHRVSYGETDCMGIMYYAEYFHLFERGRNEYIRARGITYVEVEQKGFYLPVREAQCRYKQPCSYDDLIHLRTSIAEIGRASLRFVYELWNKDKSLILALGMTQHALVNKDLHPVKFPNWLKEILLTSSSYAQ